MPVALQSVGLVSNSRVAAERHSIALRLVLAMEQGSVSASGSRLLT